MPAGDLRSQRRSCELGLPAESRKSVKASSPVRSSACPRAGRRSPGPRLQHRPATRASPPASASNLAGNDSLPAKPTSPGTATSTRDSRSTCPNCRSRLENLILKNRLIFNGRSGDGTFITTPTTCFDPEEPAHEHVYSTYLLASSIDEEEEAGLRIPGQRRAGARVAAAAGKKPIDCDHDPLRPDDRARSGHGADRLARRRDDQSRRSPTSLGGERTATARTPKKRRWRCRSGSASTPRRPTACSPAPTPSSARAPKHPVACPPESKIGTVDNRNAAAAREGSLERRRLRRQAAEPRPGLRRRVPDLRRRRVGRATASR